MAQYTNSLNSHHGESRTREFKKMTPYYKKHKRNKVREVVNRMKESDYWENHSEENLASRTTMKGHSKKFMKKFFKKKMRQALKNETNFEKFGDVTPGDFDDESVYDSQFEIMYGHADELN